MDTSGKTTHTKAFMWKRVKSLYVKSLYDFSKGKIYVFRMIRCIALQITYGYQ